jgi:hypothetical protein
VSFVSPLTSPKAVSGGIDNLIVRTSGFRRAELRRWVKAGQGNQRYCVYVSGSASCTDGARVLHDLIDLRYS